MAADQTIAPNEFRCAQCKGVFVKAWSDDQAAAERDALWGDDHPSGFVMVCDDCFKVLMHEA